MSRRKGYQKIARYVLNYEEPPSEAGRVRMIRDYIRDLDSKKIIEFRTAQLSVDDICLFYAYLTVRHENDKVFLNEEPRCRNGS